MGEKELFLLHTNNAHTLLFNGSFTLFFKYVQLCMYFQDPLPTNTYQLIILVVTCNVPSQCTDDYKSKNTCTQ